MESLRNCTKNSLKQLAYAVLSARATTSAQRSSIRTFSRTSQLAKSRNFYNDLQIPRSATQSEIKSAFYNLSMIYHPDKSKSEKSNAKFRDISEAYEVLSNIRTRRMYDKGFGSYGISSPGHDSGTESEILYEEEEEDPQTKFYKQHMVKSQPPIMADRATARDLDKWASDQISNAFSRQQNGKRMKEIAKEFSEDGKLRSKQLMWLFSICTAMFLILSIIKYLENRIFDAELQKKNQKGS